MYLNGLILLGKLYPKIVYPDLGWGSHSEKSYMQRFVKKANFDTFVTPFRAPQWGRGSPEMNLNGLILLGKFYSNDLYPVLGWGCDQEKCYEQKLQIKCCFDTFLPL